MCRQEYRLERIVCPLPVIDQSVNVDFRLTQLYMTTNDKRYAPQQEQSTGRTYISGNLSVRYLCNSPKISQRGSCPGGLRSSYATVLQPDCSYLIEQQG